MTIAEPTPNSFRSQPDENGHFGQFGGRYVAETLMPLVLDLERHYRLAKNDPAFQAQFDDLLSAYAGRGPERLALGDRALYIDFVDGAGNSRLTGPFIERRLGSKGTARNIRSLRRILDKMDEV